MRYVSFLAGLLAVCLLLTLGTSAAAASMAPMADASDTADQSVIDSSILQIGGEAPFANDAPLLEVFFLNLGQGDGFFLRCGGQTMLVDGGYADQFPILLNFLLKEHGSLRVGSMVNTHQHDDHIGAQLRLLASGGSANHFYSPLSPQAKNAAYQQLYPLLENAETPFVQLFPGDTLDFGGPVGGNTSSPTSAPLPEDQGALVITGEYAVQRESSALITAYYCTDHPPDVNAASLVLHIAFGERTLLLMADATGWTQSSLLKSVGEGLKADVIKTGHHGLEASVSEFLTMVNPMLGIITNDRTTATLQARQLEQRGIPALYTAEGLVYLATDGQTWYARQQ